MELVHDVRMDRDWTRLGKAIADARRASDCTQEQFADAIGVKRGALQNIERGKIKTVTTTLRVIESKLGWAKGSIEAVLEGGDPQGAPEPEGGQVGPEEHPLALAPELPLDILHELSAETGPVIGAGVLTVPGASPGSRLIVVFKGEPDASPEEIRADLLAWSAEQRRLRGLPTDESRPHEKREP
jgi:transcriptional regulator with XRE-family HTH domain